MTTTKTENKTGSIYTRTRPNHYGNWMVEYDGREAMEQARQMALADATACEVCGYPVADTAEEWINAMAYHVNTFGRAYRVDTMTDMAPVMPDGVAMAVKALVALAHLAKTWVHDRGGFSNYQPINTIPLAHYHALLTLAYDAPPTDRPEWEVQISLRRAWVARVHTMIDDLSKFYRNSDWMGAAAVVTRFAMLRIVTGR